MTRRTAWLQFFITGLRTGDRVKARGFLYLIVAEQVERMLFHQANVVRFISPDAATEFKAHRERNNAAQKSQYAALLQAPMSSLVSNISDRADVYFAAILGYN